jgi:hypothetical protein
MPDEAGKSHYDRVFDHLSECNRQQLAALEAFAQIGWREKW